MSAGNNQSLEELNNPTPKKRATKNAKNIYQKLADVKAEIGVISKDSTNPFFKSKYFDINNLLAHVEPILHKHGLVCLQPINNGKVETIIADVDTENEIKSELQLPELNDPQKLGSAITYYRRYTLASLLALQAEDDDANSVKPKKISNYAQTTQPNKDDKIIILPKLKMGTEAFDKVGKYMINGGDIKEVEKKYTLTETIKKVLITK